MPIHDDADAGDIPGGPHLAVVTGPGQALALTPAMSRPDRSGPRMFLVFDPTREDRKVPVIFAKMTREKLVFKCNCGQPSCNATYVYKLTVEGHHPTRR